MPRALEVLHEKHSLFVRISYNKLSINHPGVLPKVLAATFVEASAYNLFAIPKANYQNLMSQGSLPKHTAMIKNLGLHYLQHLEE